MNAPIPVLVLLDATAASPEQRKLYGSAIDALAALERLADQAGRDTVLGAAAATCRAGLALLAQQRLDQRA